MKLFIWMAMWLFLVDALSELLVLAGAFPLVAPTPGAVAGSLAINFGALIVGVLTLAQSE